MSTLVRAQSLAELGRFAEARAEVSRYLGTQPDSVAGLCLLGLCELRLNNLTETLRATQRALAQDPESEWALRLRAHALSKQGREREAVASAEAAVKVAPQFWETHYSLAFVLREHSDGTLATRAYESARRAVELAPHDPRAHVMVGLTASNLGRPNEERESYQEALRLDPAHATALNNLAAMDINSRRLASGARNLVAGLRLAPGEELLQQNLDAVGLRLMVRLLNVMLLTGVLGMIVAGSLADGAWWARATTGCVLLGAYTLVVVTTMRHLPSGARRHLRGLPRRMTAQQRLVGIALVVFTIAILIAAFGPGQLWLIGAGSMGVIVRIFQIVLVVSIIRGVIGWVGRRRL